MFKMFIRIYKALRVVFSERVVLALHLVQIAVGLAWLLGLWMVGRSGWPWYIVFAWFEVFVIAHLFAFLVAGAFLGLQRASGYELLVRHRNASALTVWPVLNWIKPDEQLPNSTDEVIFMGRTGAVYFGFFRGRTFAAFVPATAVPIQVLNVTGWVYLKDLLTALSPAGIES